MDNKQFFGLALIIFIIGEAVSFKGMAFNFNMFLYSLTTLIATMIFPSMIALVVFLIGKARKKSPTGGLRTLAVAALVMSSFQTIMALVMG